MSVKWTTAEKNLIKRYLLWCYKTTKEDLDRIDRRFTQVQVDRYILGKMSFGKTAGDVPVEYSKLFNDFKVYIEKKEADGLSHKFIKSNRKDLLPGYKYLQDRLSAIEKAVQYFLGVRALADFNAQYENEMTRRILESREH